MWQTPSITHDLEPVLSSITLLALLLILSGIVAACVLPIEEGPVNILIGNEAEVPVKASFHGLSLASSLIEHTFLWIVVDWSTVDTLCVIISLQNLLSQLYEASSRHVLTLCLHTAHSLIGGYFFHVIYFLLIVGCVFLDPSTVFLVSLEYLYLVFFIIAPSILSFAILCTYSWN